MGQHKTPGETLGFDAFFYRTARFDQMGLSDSENPGFPGGNHKGVGRLVLAVPNKDVGAHRVGVVDFNLISSHIPGMLMARHLPTKYR